MLDFITKSSSDQVLCFHTLWIHTGDLNFCLKHPAQILFFIIIVSIISIFIITIIIIITVFLLLPLLYHPVKDSRRGLSLLWVSSILLLLLVVLLLLFSYFTTNIIISGIVVSQNIKLHPTALGVQYSVKNLCCAQRASLEVKKCSHIVLFRHTTSSNTC